MVFNNYRQRICMHIKMAEFHTLALCLFLIVIFNALTLHASENSTQEDNTCFIMTTAPIKHINDVPRKYSDFALKLYSDEALKPTKWSSYTVLPCEDQNDCKIHTILDDNTYTMLAESDMWKIMKYSHIFCRSVNNPNIKQGIMTLCGKQPCSIHKLGAAYASVIARLKQGWQRLHSYPATTSSEYGCSTVLFSEIPKGQNLFIKKSILKDEVALIHLLSRKFNLHNKIECNNNSYPSADFIYLWIHQDALFDFRKAFDFENI